MDGGERGRRGGRGRGWGKWRQMAVGGGGVCSRGQAGPGGGRRGGGRGGGGGGGGGGGNRAAMGRAGGRWFPPQKGGPEEDKRPRPACPRAVHFTPKPAQVWAGDGSKADTKRTNVRLLPCA